MLLGFCRDVKSFRQNGPRSYRLDLHVQPFQQRMDLGRRKQHSPPLQVHLVTAGRESTARRVPPRVATFRVDATRLFRGRIAAAISGFFGGLGCDASGTAGDLDDLWEFNPQSMTWTWRSGSNSVGPAREGTGGPSGVYGTQGTAAATNVPGGRSSAMTWSSPGGNLWLFGGTGQDSAGETGELNDLWSYQP